MTTFDDEKYKELIYDIQRAGTDKDAHELILKYVDPSDSGDNIRCIKEVIMNGTGIREFTKDKTYRMQIMHNNFYTTNDSGTYHGFDMDGWFQEHFELI